MNFIVYGNKDSPVVPILTYHFGKLKYVCVVSAVDIHVHVYMYRKNFQGEQTNV